MTKKQSQEDKARERNTAKALKIIATSKTQAEAYARFLETFPAGTKVNPHCWYAYIQLPETLEA